MDIQDFTADATEHFQDKEIIIKDGDTCSEKMYIIICGKVGIYKNYGELGQVQIASLSAGDFFGEMSLFLGQGRTATVVADGDVSAFVLDRDNALEFFKLQPRATFALIQSLCARIVNTNTSMADNSVKYERTVIDLNIEKEVLRTTANTDALTGVFNRRYFMETAETMREDAATCKKDAYVALIDLDFFKKVNDTYGHQAGDETLKMASKVVSSTIRTNDLFARYGGEEFIMFFVGLSKSETGKLVERIRANIENTDIVFEDKLIKVTASFGIADAIAAKDLDAAIASADEALYKAKEQGRNRYIFAEETKQ